MNKAIRFLALSLPLLAGCDSQEVEAARRGVSDALRDMRELTVDMKDELFEGIEEQQEELEEALRDLRDELESNEELKREIQEKRAEVRRLLDEARSKGGEAWEGTRDALLDALGELEELVREHR